MDKKVLIIILIVSVAINLATMFTFGYFWWTRQTSRREFLARPHMVPDWQHTRFVRELKLNDDQIEQIRKANEEMRNALRPLREELFEKRRELMSLVREKEPDRRRADALLEEIALLQARHDEYIFDRLFMMKSILTPEQQRKLGALLHTLLEEGRPHEMPHRPGLPYRHFELPRGEKGR
jgi:Spy/CpxP family protein refolding chaperone